MRTSWLLLLFALPSLIGSVFLMRLAGAGQSLQIQQMAVALIGIVYVLGVDKARRNQNVEVGSSIPQQPRNSVFILALTLISLAACFAFSEAGNPSRWLKFGGIRLYFSAVVLPMALYVFARLHWRLQFSAYANVILILVFSALLALQPDLSQVIAFALAALFIVWHRAGGLVLKVGASAVLGLLCYWCWQQPDPLRPVPYVEGVIQLAGSAGIVAMLAAILSLALIPIGLFYVAIKHCKPELMPIALYYSAIMICAYLGLTPMPLLGFGAGPVMGYFLLLGMHGNSCKNQVSIMSVSPSIKLIEQRVRNRIFEYFEGVVEYEKEPGAWDLNELVNEWETNVSDPFDPSDYPYPVFSEAEKRSMAAAHTAWLQFAHSTPPNISDEKKAFVTPEWKAFVNTCKTAVTEFSKRGRLSEESEID